MVRAHLRSRQIFKFGLLTKKNNKKNLKIRLVFNRMDSVQICPTVLIHNRSLQAKKTLVKKLKYSKKI
jgi:hypothetical protein